MYTLPRRNRTAVASIALIAASVLAGCSSSADDGASELGTAKAGEILVGSDLTQPPYDYLEGDDPAGFDPDLLRAVGEVLDVKIVTKDTRFGQLITSLRAKQFDMIASAMYVTEEREETVDFVPYFSAGSIIVAKKEGAFQPATPSDLCGKSVAAIKGGDQEARLSGPESDACEEAGEEAIDVRAFPTEPEGLQALAAGNVDAGMLDAAIGAAAIEKLGDSLVISSQEQFYLVPVGFAVAEGNKALADALRDALETLKEDGTYDELLQRYNLAPLEPS